MSGWESHERQFTRWGLLLSISHPCLGPVGPMVGPALKARSDPYRADLPQLYPTVTLQEYTPQVEDGFGGALLIDKHILPVDHGESVEHRAQRLDRCKRDSTKDHYYPMMSEDGRHKFKNARFGFLVMN